MKHSIFFLALATISATAIAADEKAAVAVVKKYSESIACQIVEARDDRNQFRAATLVPGDKESQGLGSVHVVYWAGDVGCAGGNGTVRPNFTVVEHNGFMSASPVVALDYKFPELELEQLTGISIKNGELVIQGLIYGPNDQQHRPQKRVTYTLKIDQERRAFFKR